MTKNAESAPAPPDDPGHDDPRRCLSALADGDASALEAACRLWREDALARRTWHDYHLIGDVLRSDDLAGVSGHDATFVRSLRLRLAREPALLVATGDAPPPPGLGWRWPAAAAVGVAAVVAGVAVMRPGAPALPASTEVLAAASVPAATPAAPVLAGGMIRDAHLDELLRAHESMRGTAGDLVPGGTLRRVDVVVPVVAER